MPITPFHFGPGAALHAIAPKHVSFLAFCAANVLIDLESLYNLVYQQTPVHAFFHTYIGATLVLVAVIGLFAVLRFAAARQRLPNLFQWQALRYRQVSIGAALGAYSHVLLDSLMHADITPFAPLTHTNGLLGFVSLNALHWACILAAVLGAVRIHLRKGLANRDRAA